MEGAHPSMEPREFRGRIINRMVATLAALFCFAFGGSMLYAAAFIQHTIGDRFAAGLGGLIPLLFGLWAAGKASLAFGSLTIAEEGVTQRSLRKTRRVSWSDVARIELGVSHYHGHGMTAEERMAVLWSRDGRKLMTLGSTYPYDALDYFVSAARRCGVPSLPALPIVYAGRASHRVGVVILSILFAAIIWVGVASADPLDATSQRTAFGMIGGGAVVLLLLLREANFAFGALLINEAGVTRIGVVGARHLPWETVATAGASAISLESSTLGTGERRLVLRSSTGARLLTLGGTWPREALRVVIRELTLRNEGA